MHRRTFLGLERRPARRRRVRWLDPGQPAVTRRCCSPPATTPTARTTRSAIAWMAHRPSPPASASAATTWRRTRRLPLAVFVGRRPSRESYLIDPRDGRLLQTLASPADRHFYGHGVFHQAGEWLLQHRERHRRARSRRARRLPPAGLRGCCAWPSTRPTASARTRCCGCPTAKPWWWPTAASAPRPTAARCSTSPAMEPSLVLMTRDGDTAQQGASGRSR